MAPDPEPDPHFALKLLDFRALRAATTVAL